MRTLTPAFGQLAAEVITDLPEVLEQADDRHIVRVQKERAAHGSPFSVAWQAGPELVGQCCVAHGQSAQAGQ